MPRTKRMTKQELIDKLKVVAQDAPSEETHIEADYLLLEYIADADVTLAFLSIPKWYA